MRDEAHRRERLGPEAALPPQLAEGAPDLPGVGSVLNGDVIQTRSATPTQNTTMSVVVVRVDDPVREERRGEAGHTFVPVGSFGRCAPSG